MKIRDSVRNEGEGERFYIQVCDGCKEKPETCGKWFVDCEQERDGDL